jgi:hypothetical protein
MTDQPSTAPQDLVATARSQVYRVLSQRGQEAQGVAYAVELTIVPDPARPGALIPVLAIVLSNEQAYTVRVVMDLHVGDEAVLGLVEDMLAHLAMSGATA